MRNAGGCDDLVDRVDVESKALIDRHTSSVFCSCCFGKQTDPLKAFIRNPARLRLAFSARLPGLLEPVELGLKIFTRVLVVDTWGEPDVIKRK